LISGIYSLINGSIFFIEFLTRNMKFGKYSWNKPISKYIGINEMNKMTIKN